MHKVIHIARNDGICRTIIAKIIEFIHNSTWYDHIINILWEVNFTSIMASVIIGLDYRAVLYKFMILERS